jgi:hypothetical protein
MHLSYIDFKDFDNFVTSLLEVLKTNVQYSLLLKVCYKKTKYEGDLYGMLGEQVGLIFTSNEDIEVFEDLHKSYKESLYIF